MGRERKEEEEQVQETCAAWRMETVACIPGAALVEATVAHAVWQHNGCSRCREG